MPLLISNHVFDRIGTNQIFTNLINQGFLFKWAILVLKYSAQEVPLGDKTSKKTISEILSERYEKGPPPSFNIANLGLFEENNTPQTNEDIKALTKEIMEFVEKETKDKPANVYFQVQYTLSRFFREIEQFFVLVSKMYMTRDNASFIPIKENLRLAFLGKAVYRSQLSDLRSVFPKLCYWALFCDETDMQADDLGEGDKLLKIEKAIKKLKIAKNSDNPKTIEEAEKALKKLKKNGVPKEFKFYRQYQFFEFAPFFPPKPADENDNEPLDYSYYHTGKAIKLHKSFYKEFMLEFSTYRDNFDDRLQNMTGIIEKFKNDIKNELSYTKSRVTNRNLFRYHLVVAICWISAISTTMNGVFVSVFEDGDEKDTTDVVAEKTDDHYPPMYDTFGMSGMNPISGSLYRPEMVIIKTN